MEKLLIVLDLDETLIHATTREDIGREPDFRIEEWKVFRRLFLKPFLDFCFENFRVGVWTSAGSLFADAVVSESMNNRNLEFVWSSERCTRTYDIERFEYFPQKDLKKLIKNGYQKEKILAVDDTPEKWAQSYGNYIQVSEFRGKSNDSELDILMRYLNTLTNCENVRCIEKRNWRENTINSTD